VVIAAVCVAGLYIVASSAAFQNLVRQRLVSILQDSTGGRVEIAVFHWHLLNLEAEAGGIVIHGLEAQGEEPYARIEHLRARASLLGLFSPRILLRNLVITRPELNLIVYPDGSTNQPKPRKASKPGRPPLDRFFDLQAGHISIEQGTVRLQDRDAAYEVKNHSEALDFDATDVSILMQYAAAAGSNPENYRIELGATGLDLSPGGVKGKVRPAHGHFQATLEILRDAIVLRSLRVTAGTHTLDIGGSVRSFVRPNWQARCVGDVDLSLLDFLTGDPLQPGGIATLDLAGAGQGGQFRLDGTVHVENGAYVDPNVTVKGVRLDARIHADPGQLQVSSIVARLRQGGEVLGGMKVAPWLPETSSTAVMGPTGQTFIGATRPAGSHAQEKPPHMPIPSKIAIVAALKSVALDSILDAVGESRYRRLGLDAGFSGPVHTEWTRGTLRQTLTVAANLSVSPSVQPVPGEAPVTGTVDGIYTHRDGAVDLHKLEVNLPASSLEAHGKLGAHPVASPSQFAIEFHSRDLGEFDTVLRVLGLNRNGKTGAAALPVTLAGQVDFLHGTWAGSLAEPRLTGNLKATDLAIELPVQPNAKSSQPQYVRWDSVEAAGSYSAQRIAIDLGELRRGKAEFSLNGSLDAGPGPGGEPSFVADPVLHVHLRAAKVSLDDVLPLTGQNIPISGLLDAQVQADGPIRNLGGSGWVELDGGTIYGEPVARIRAQGTAVNQEIKLASVTVSEQAGKISASGDLDLKSRRFQLDARGSGIDMAKVNWLRQQGTALTGKLGFTVLGSGTLDDPRLEAHASLSGLAVSGEQLGALEFAAKTANQSATFDVSTHLETAELTAHGQTELSGDFATHATLEFSKFNIDALLKMAHVKGLNGESALAGTVTLAGPLAHPEQFRGEARIRELEVTVSSVHLRSEGGVHATMTDGRIKLDPLHVTGENTDLHIQGGLSLKDKRQLDVAASGSINLKLTETLDPDLTASGITTFQMEAHGPLSNPDFKGRIDCQDGSLALEDVPNGLSQLKGTLEFNNNRLEVKKLTAMSGGGPLSVGGYLSYQHGIYADLNVTGSGIRIRYPEGVSSLADLTLRLQGPQSNLRLSGNVLVTRFAVSPDLDIAALAAQAGTAQAIAPPDAPSNHFQLDILILSTPQLNFQNAIAKLAGDVDLHIRGTLASPSLLGRISVTEGSATIAGTRYELQSGDVVFTNPVRIEPSIDLNATARVEDYDITLGLHGTLQKPSVTYRSDPPLPEGDVLALLALGRTQDQQRLFTQQQVQSGSGNPTTDALLGGALNATVSSRVQKLFGAGSVKVDPNYLGALGNSTSRITVEEQLGKDVTLTYATNVNTTGQQLLQAEIAINRHVSLLVARDESGVFSMVVKATRRYR
jgi:translocation and assembly module TamB